MHSIALERINDYKQENRHCQSCFDSLSNLTVFPFFVEILHCRLYDIDTLRHSFSYFLPEDGDTEHNPNVFLAPKPRQPGAPPTLADIKHAFPLPGKYHFRFKSPLVSGGDREKHCVAVWMDCVDDRQLIPIWKNAIIAKVTRISAEDDDDDDDEEEHYAASTPAPIRHSTQQQQQQQQQVPPPSAAVHHTPDLDIFGGGSHSAPPSIPVSASNSMHNFLDVPPSSSLLDMHAPIQPASSSGSGANDFLGMMSSTTPSTPAPFGQPGYQGYPQTTPATLPRPTGNNAFDNFTTSSNTGPFGGLEWK